MKRYFLFLTALLLGLGISAQPSYESRHTYKSDSITIKKLVDEVMISSTAYSNLRYLCKRIGPRLSGSPNALKAIYAGKKMLQDAGADTVYLQPCMVTHWIRGEKETGYFIAEGKKIPLHLTSLGNSEGSRGKMIEGDIAEVKSMEELHK